MAGPNSIIRKNRVEENENDGINTDRASIVDSNVSDDNDGDGIEVSGTGSTVTNNVTSLNDQYGIRFPSTAPQGIYSGNNIVGNVLGTVLNGAQTGTNFCNANTTCP